MRLKYLDVEQRKRSITTSYITKEVQADDRVGIAVGRKFIQYYMKNSTAIESKSAVTRERSLGH